MATPSETLPSPSAEDVERHHGMRETLRALHDKLVPHLPPELLGEIGGYLEWVDEAGTLRLPSEEAVGPFLDLCVQTGEVGEHAFLTHFRLRQGETGNPVLTGEEREMLDLLDTAVHAVLRVDASEPGVGVRVREIFTGRRLFLMDEVLSHEQHVAGACVCGHLIPVGERVMTTGALVSLGRWSREDLRRLLRQAGVDPRHPGQSPRDVARAVTALGLHLTLGAPASLASAPATRTKGAGRNAPCPCGSGAKYKRCCGA